MVRFLADEDFNGRIVRGLRLVYAELDLVRAQDVGLSGASDTLVLQWAADDDRVLLTHDRRTIPRHFKERLAAGLHTPGIIIVGDLESIGACIEDVLLVAECLDAVEWIDQILYLPLK